jgi:rhomboid protease GluP
MTDPQTPLDWIEMLAKLSGWIGMNPVRTRWKLMAWRESLQRKKNQTQTTVEHVRYAHKICPYCGTLQDQGRSRCVACGRSLSPRWIEMVRRLGLQFPHFQSVSSLIAFALFLIYIRMILTPGTGTFFSFTAEGLVRFGAHYPPFVAQGEWWRLFTAVFLHGGLFHIAFNVMALLQIGPWVEQIFGKKRMLFYFMLTGVLANVGYQFFGGNVVSIGASGALMGLIGLAGGWGHKDGSGLGRAVRDQMVKWAVYTVLFGFMIGANNIAHVGGFLSGFLLGLGLKPVQFQNPSYDWWYGIEGLLGLVSAFATLALCLFPLPWG